MTLVELTLEGGGSIHINPAQVSHFEPKIGESKTLLWLKGDNMPTTIDEPYLDVAQQINDALYDDAPLYAMRNEFSTHAHALIHEINRLQWAFGISALAFLVLLLVIVGRAH